MILKKLFSIYMLIGILQMANAQFNVHVNGQLTNTNGVPIIVQLNYYEGSFIPTITAFSVTTDANGYYSHTYVSTIDSGYVVLDMQDCNSDSIYDAQVYSLPLADTIINLTTFDYCPTTATNCFAYFTANQALDVNNLAIPGQLIVTDSSSTSGTSNLTYAWDFGDGSAGTGSTLSHTYNGNGPYVLCLTIADGSGCTDTYCDTISVDSLGIIESEGFTINIGIEPILAIEKTDFSSVVNIYPNPATNYIDIEFNVKDNELNKISMIDLSGKVVFVNNNPTSSSNLTTIDIENFTPGTYFIQILFDNKIHNEKVIVK
ncbi:MAG: PKD domain-containing protein [Crocinitomicaceae bacterium]